MLRHTGRLAGVVSGAAALSGVVEQAGKVEQGLVLDVAQDSAEARRPLAHGAGLRVLKAVERVNENHGVLVDGVTVVGIADHERVDAVELRKDELKDPDGVHRAERIAGMRADENLTQATP